MRILLDSNIGHRLRLALTADGHDVDWVQSWPFDPGDSHILERAHIEQRVVITLDKDFGTLAVLYRQKHSGIVRMYDSAIDEQPDLCRRCISLYGDELMLGAIVTASHRGIRIRLSH